MVSPMALSHDTCDLRFTGPQVVETHLLLPQAALKRTRIAIYNRASGAGFHTSALQRSFGYQRGPLGGFQPLPIPGLFS